MISPGGIENPGFNCPLHVVLQDFASETEYDSMFSPGGASIPVETLRAKVSSCVTQIRLGITIPRQEGNDLRKSLIDAGWKDDFSGILGKIFWILYRLFGIYPPMDAFQLYGFLRTTLDNCSFSEICVNEEIVGYKELRGDQLFIRHGLGNLPQQSGQQITKVSMDPNRECTLERPGLQLRQIHMHRFGHTWIYRKVGETWYSLSDDRITQVAEKNLPKKGILRLVYTASA